MKKLTKLQKEKANKAVKLLKEIQESGVEIMVIDGGGGSCGLSFWRPSEEERRDAYDIVTHNDERCEEFEEKYYYPSESIGLRIDYIIP